MTAVPRGFVGRQIILPLGEKSPEEKKQLQFAQLFNRKKNPRHDGCASSTCLRANPKIKRRQ